ncbi:MAG TPA: AI-2E family transporter [Microvirga sp.]|jgi:predicted PurR-regulated permease PerM/GAF domain-containing protein|nr:AI-2E family transporter [Microvirga sp.]
MAEPAPLTPAPAPPAPAHPSLLTAGGIVLAIGALYFGQDIFVPFALAILLSFALTPLVTWLRRFRFPRIAAVLVAVTLAFVLIGGITFVVGRQLVQLANNLPSYQTTISEKIRSLQASAPGGSVVERVTTTIQDLSKEISGGDDAAPKPPASLGGAPQQEPVTVRLEREQAQPLEVIQTVVGPLLAPLATAGLVVIFVIFILLEQEDLRDRFIKLVGGGDLQRSTQALNDAAARVSRYLLMQLVVNLTYGVPIGLALYFIGVPNAVLWGLLAAVLRFIPYLGPFLAALFPIALAFAVDPGWSMLLWVVGLFLLAELVSNNVVEPWLYGASTGLSSLAIIMAAIFWTTLWGPVGLFLATPLTVCVVVIGRYVPQLEFLGVLLGSDPVLAPEERLYQRLLAGNLEEAVEIAEDYVDQRSSREFYDHVAIPALRLAENDRQRHSADPTFRRSVATTAICVAREIADHVRDKATSATAGHVPAVENTSASGAEVEVLCLAGRTELDHAAAEMLGQVLGEARHTVRVLPPIAVSEGALGQLDLRGVKVVCLSYLHPQPQVYARYICRRLRRRAPGIKLLVCLWNVGPTPGDADHLVRQVSADAAPATIEAALDHVTRWLASDATVPSAAESAAGAEHERMQAVDALNVKDQTAWIEALSKQVAAEFNVPIARASLIEEARRSHDPRSHPGSPGSGAGEPLYDVLDSHVIETGAPVVVEDATKDERFADAAVVLEKGVRFYAGAPLRTAAGQVVGALSLIDTSPRSLSEAEERRLAERCNELMRGVEQGA